MREWEARLRTKMLRFKENSSTVFFLSFEHALSSLNKLSLRKMCRLILANLTISPYNPAASLRRYLLICTLKPLEKRMFFLLFFKVYFETIRNDRQATRFSNASLRHRRFGQTPSVSVRGAELGAAAAAAAAQ